MTITKLMLGLGFALALATPLVAYADPPGDPAAVTNDQGMWRDAIGDPTYKVSADGTVDWYTYSGFRRYHSECHVCHGPDGEGSSYAPALADSPKRSAMPNSSGSSPAASRILGRARKRLCLPLATIRM